MKTNASRHHPALCRTVASLLAALSTAAWAATPLPPLPDDDMLDLAAEQQHDGHAERAAQTLLGLAERGHVLAMERLALLHWYGPDLHPGGPWRREVALRWFSEAAERGSPLGQHMLRVATRLATR